MFNYECSLPVLLFIFQCFTHIFNAGELTDQLSELNLAYDRKNKIRKLPPNYLCHLCFKKGHHIKECPQVRKSLLMIELI